MSISTIISKLVAAGHEDLATQLITADDAPPEDIGDLDLTQKIADFFREHPNPEDSAVHDFAEGLGIDPHDFEEHVYKLLTSLLTSVGKHNNIPDSEFDQEQLAMGIKVEMEHTDDPYISKCIVKDHLVELPSDYYTKLAKMEEDH